MGNILARIQSIATNEGVTIGAMERSIGASKGVLSRAINNGTDIQSKWLEVIVENYPKYSAEWLLSGRGSMLADERSAPVVSSDPAIGSPYYDVDFIGGFDEVFNSQVSVPSTNIIIRGFEKAQMWCNVTGHSMEPKINHGDIIGLHECRVEDIQFGEIYAVVLDTLRTIKILRKSADPLALRYVPINTADYDEQDFPISRIIKIYEVIGSVKKFF